MTKIYSTGKSPDFNTITANPDKIKNFEDYQKEIILFFDQGIGGVDIARGVLTQGDNSDVLPRYVHDGLSGALVHLIRARELMEEMFDIYETRQISDHVM